MERERTASDLAQDLRRLGVERDDTVLVQSSLRSIGRVNGGPACVVQALLDVVGQGGTLVVPTYTAGNCDPSRWALTRGRPELPTDWPRLRDEVPPFDPGSTPSEGMGAVAETVRVWPGALRSIHPQTSFAAVGARAEEITTGHEQDCHLGPASPLGRLAAAGARVLLLGVPYGACTAFHLAEYQVPEPPVRDYECIVLDRGVRTWYRYTDVALDDSDFQRLGEALERSPSGAGIRHGRVGNAPSRLLQLNDAVAFATAWLVTLRVPRLRVLGQPT